MLQESPSSKDKENTPYMCKTLFANYSDASLQSHEKQLESKNRDLLESKIDKLSEIILSMDSRLKVVEEKCKKLSDKLNSFEC